MNKLVSSLFVSGTLIAGSAAPALAAWNLPIRRRSPVHSVPEIDASAGLLAVAAVLVILAFVWERKRRTA